jgi:hypothetical protein
MGAVSAFRGEEGHIPIFDNIPPERVGGVDKRDDKSVDVRERHKHNSGIQSYRRRIMLTSLYPRSSRGL